MKSNIRLKARPLVNQNKREFSIREEDPVLRHFALKLLSKILKNYYLIYFSQKFNFTIDVDFDEGIKKNVKEN